MLVSKRLHYVVAGLVWGVPGVMITAKGIGAYCALPRAELWWLLLQTMGVLVAFGFMFRHIVGRYIAHISALPDRASPLRTFPLRGWLIIVFMMGLGIVLKHIPAIPQAFTAAFYSGLGPMLLLSAFRFFFAPNPKYTIQ